MTRALAALTGVVRVVSYLQITPDTRPSWFKIPPLGTILVIAAYGVFVLCLQFIHDDVPLPSGIPPSVCALDGLRWPRCP